MIKFLCDLHIHIGNISEGAHTEKMGLSGFPKQCS